MGIFKRISDILKANINDLIDRAEDPEKMVKQIIIDLQKEVANSTQALGKAMASERMAQRQYENAVAQSADWENKAKAALKKGDTNLAKAALANKVKSDEHVEAYYKMYQDISTQTEAIRGQVEALKSKLQEAKSREAMLIARAQMAETKKSLAQATGGIDTNSAFEKFNRMEEKIAKKEAEADAFAEISGQGTSDMNQFAQLESDVKVDEELQRLMEEMGQTGSVSASE